MVNNKGWEVCRWWNGTKLSHSATTFFATVTLLLAIADLDKSRSERVCFNGPQISFRLINVKNAHRDLGKPAY